MGFDMAHTHEEAAHDTDVVAGLVVSGSYCVACIARKAEMAIGRVMEAFRRIEDDWREQLIDTAPCTACRVTTTVYSLRLP